MEDALARTCNRILFCDTDAFSTNMWHERYFGRLSPEVAALSSGGKYDLHLLADAGFPVVEDELRDGASIRHAMQRRFIEESRKRNRPFIHLTCDHTTRFAAAVEACGRMMG